MTNTTEYDFIEVDICADCLLWWANGDLSGIEDPDRIFVVMTAAGIDEGYDVVPGETEGFFSKSPCDSCQSPLGGQRYTATMVSQLPLHVTERKDA
jgi:hypothetical protein